MFVVKRDAATQPDKHENTQSVAPKFGDEVKTFWFCICPIYAFQITPKIQDGGGKPF